jgi:hypothetical protein
MSNRPTHTIQTEVLSRHLSGEKTLPPSRSRPVPRRGLSRAEASIYLGVSPSKFDELVKGWPDAPTSRDRFSKGVGCLRA